MSYMKCKSIKYNGDGTYTVAVAANNVVPVEYDKVIIDANKDDNGMPIAGQLALDRIVSMVYYGDLHFLKSALRCKWGMRVHNAIDQVTKGNPVWCSSDYPMSEEDKQREEEELKMCKALAHSCER